MRVGDSLQIYYALPGPLPAGAYSLLVRGYTAAADAKLHADLLRRPADAPDGGAADQVIASVDSSPPPAGGGFHLQSWIEGILCAPAIAAEPGDGLVLRIQYQSGAKDFTVVETSLSIP